jgi:site-specific recombinase XerD
MAKSNGKPTAKSTSSFFPQKLYQRMSDDLHLTGKAERTRRGYLREVRKLAEFSHRSPDKITENHVRRYFLHLKNERQLAYGSLRVALSGIKFFYTVTCKREWDILAMLKLQNITALPEVLTIKQVDQIIEATTTLRMRTFFWTVYSMGLRLNEGLHLQVGDIDAARGLVHVHRGKGAKDRYIPLPTSTLLMLREYWATHRHKRFLFPADGRNHTLQQNGPSVARTPMSETAVQGAMKKITKQIDFGKKVHTHTLRHSYATHLLEAGVSLKVIQKYMGHSSLQTTMVYLHLTETAEADSRKVIEKLFRRRP